ncbi:MAG: hypothetical protein ACE5JG_11115 [Planctomycetota bacterium]
MSRAIALLIAFALVLVAGCSQDCGAKTPPASETTSQPGGTAAPKTADYECAACGKVVTEDFGVPPPS